MVKWIIVSKLEDSVKYVVQTIMLLYLLKLSLMIKIDAHILRDNQNVFEHMSNLVWYVDRSIA